MNWFQLFISSSNLTFLLKILIFRPNEVCRSLSPSLFLFDRPAFPMVKMDLEFYPPPNQYKPWQEPIFSGNLFSNPCLEGFMLVGGMVCFDQIRWAIRCSWWQEWQQPKRTSFQLGNNYFCITRSENVFKLIKFAVCGNVMFFALLDRGTSLKEFLMFERLDIWASQSQTNHRDWETWSENFNKTHWNMNQGDKSDNFSPASGCGW